MEPGKINFALKKKDPFGFRLNDKMGGGVRMLARGNGSWAG